MYKDDEIICHCEQVTYKKIVDAIKNGANTVEELSDLLDVGIACGYCIEDLENIIEFLK